MPKVNEEATTTDIEKWFETVITDVYLRMILYLFLYVYHALLINWRFYLRMIWYLFISICMLIMRC
jgi:hypothetical protein